MKALTGLLAAGLLILLCQHVHAGSTTPTRQIATLISLAGKQPHSSNGQEFFTMKHGGDWSCASCHTVDPAAWGLDIKSGKPIQPISPAVNPERFTDIAKTEQWFRRGCHAVIGRECTPEEKSDVLAWLLKPKT